MFNIKDFGLSEKVGVGTALHKAGVYKVQKGSRLPNAISARKKQQEASAKSYKNMGVDPSVAYGAPYKTIKNSEVKENPGFRSIANDIKSSSSSNKSVIKAIGRGWDDSDDMYDDTKKSIRSQKNYISNIGKVKDRYLDSLNNYNKKTHTAIDGNRQLIRNNQKTDLDTLAGQTRKSMNNTNVMLGVKGATGGSASRAANRAIASSAGRERSHILTGWGDEMSGQNQAATNATDDYNLKRGQAYKWEEEASKQAMEDYRENEEALNRLKGKRSKWKREDVEAESDRNLQKFFESLGNIQMRARAFRDDLSARITEYGGSADELNNAAINVNAPAELDTPDFNENIDITSEENVEDWYDPENKDKKRIIKDYDALGNPIYADEVA